MKIVLVCASGAYLQKTGAFSKAVCKGVSAAFIDVLLPCLLFTQILQMMSVEVLPKLGWLAMANIVCVTVGLGIGYLAVLATRPPKDMRSILIAAPAIGHANAIPFMLVSLIISEDGIFQPGDIVIAQSYVGLYLVMHSITGWGVGLSIIKKDEADVASLPEREATNDSRGTEALRGKETIASSTSEPSDPSEPSRREVEVDMELGSASATEKASCCHCCRPRIWSQSMPRWVNRPMMTAILSVVLGLIPGLKGVVASVPPLSFVFSAMSSLGATAPVMSLLPVGASFVADGIPRPSIIGYKALLAIVVCRLLLLPAVCISLWVALRCYVPFFPQDPSLMLVMCLECCTPTAYNLVTVCIVMEVGAKELTTGLFYQNLAAIVTLTLWIAIIMALVI